jgi:GNAT superfamily N-acetyltransferase
MRKAGRAIREAQIRRWTKASLPPGLKELAIAARQDGHEFLFRFEAEWTNGALRFDGPGECLFIARAGSALVGVGGICRDPYQDHADVGRLRHVYVDRDFRSRGLARELVLACLACTGAYFRIIRLKTVNPVAGRLYERLGFDVVTVEGQPMTHCLQTRGDG